MKVKNIIIKQTLKEIAGMSDYYAKVKKTCELAGLVVFYGKTPNATHEELTETEKLALETINQAIERYHL